MNNGLKCYSCLQSRTQAPENRTDRAGDPMVGSADEPYFEEFQSYVKEG